MEQGGAGSKAPRRAYRLPGRLDAAVICALQSAGRPLTAYALEAMLALTPEQITAPQIYRVLDRLIAARRVCKIELLRAYMSADGQEAAVVHLVCRDCGSHRSQSAAEARRQLEAIAASRGFTPHHHIIEILGLCASCAIGPT